MSIAIHINCYEVNLLVLIILLQLDALYVDSFSQIYSQLVHSLEKKALSEYASDHSFCPRN